LQRRGDDVYVSGAAAYSTLGWFSDPVLNTFLEDSKANIARLIFHELAHQRLYIPGDSAFNEAFAVAVERDLRRWLIDRAWMRSVHWFSSAGRGRTDDGARASRPRAASGALRRSFPPR
jgi:predicted aminopeptidase